MNEFAKIKAWILAGLRRGHDRTASGADYEPGQDESTSPLPEPVDVPPDTLQTETLLAAIDALKLELKFTLGDFPTDAEWKAWLKGFGDNDNRMIEIVQTRNPWAAKFSERFPGFWRDLRRQVGI
ncbi:hypothetical protein [Burkholderia pseudomallei]|uniref:hypothetical protein n=1 Tax=Burkholderia pseudomallei TaxID=28450 RepID=UPI000A1A29B3|nr:hypothetical protein [Burkholderia pseudomallei]ARL04310.1 hypothetical protein BOC44_21320 [Burkholderia pseudomallei]